MATTNTEKQPANPAPPALDPAQQQAVEATVKAYLDTNLEELVKAAMPETPEQQQQRERETFDETARKQREAAARKAKRDEKARIKAEEDAAKALAKLDADAEKAFASATPFTGSVEDITAKIVRGVLIDNGKAYSADHEIAVRFGELEPTTDGALVLNAPIELPARGREFSVKGVSLLTDAGRLRIELNGSRKCGGGKAVSFPAKSLVFRPHVEKPEEAAA